MAEFIKKIVRKQSRSISPAKRCPYETIPWSTPYSYSLNENLNLPALFNPYSTTDHNCNICQYCHAALHHECLRRNRPTFPETDLHLPSTNNEHGVGTVDADNPQSYNDTNQYQSILSNNYHFNKYDFQFWKPQENAMSNHEFEAMHQFPSSSHHHSKEATKEKRDSQKKRNRLDITDRLVSVGTEAIPCSTEHFNDVPVFVEDGTSTRHRSHSPKKSPALSSTKSTRKSRSKSPVKKTRHTSNTFSYVSPQCQNEGCSSTIFVEDTKFVVCKQQLSHVSEYFRSLFMANRSIPITGATQNSLNEYSVVVSSFTHPPPATQFKWFLESIIQAPVLRDITDDTLETLMRLSKRFRAQGLEMRCARYIQENVNKKSPMVALCWLNWVLKHKFDKATHDACLPRVATSSLNCLEEHRAMITEKLLADLFAAKLRAAYAQVVNIFQTIHSMDHFYVEVDKCPRCGRQRDQSKIRLYVSPCKRSIGCERCFKERECDVANRSPGSYQAFYRCPHGLIALNDRTSDCHCQVKLLAAQLSDLCIDKTVELKKTENS